MNDYLNVRKAQKEDISRISEIYIFNNRQVYYPIFKNDMFSFKQLQVFSYALKFNEETLDNVYVYDDGIIKGFVIIEGKEICKLHVESFFSNNGVGGTLLEYAVLIKGASYLWTLEKNNNAIAFYKKHGFIITGEKKKIYGVNNNYEYCIKLKKV